MKREPVYGDLASFPDPPYSPRTSTRRRRRRRPRSLKARRLSFGSKDGRGKGGKGGYPRRLVF